MKKTFLAGLVTGLLLIGIVGMANATTITLDSLINTNLNPVTLELDAGFYNVTPIAGEGEYVAWNAWGNTTNGHGWLNNYSLSSVDFDAYLVRDNIRYSTDVLALENARSTSFTLLNDDTVVNFYIGDCSNCYSDNIGEITLNVEKGTAPVPEPATFFLLGGGLAGLAFYRRKKK